MPSSKFSPTSTRSRTRGVAAVEFGFLVIPMSLMIFGTTELGRAIYTYNTLDKSVRDAVRHLSQHGAGNATAAAEARCLAVHGNTTCSGQALAPALSTGNVVIRDAVSDPGDHAAVSTGLGSVNLVSVAITDYQFDSVVDFVIPDMAFGNISATMRAQL
jgi:Flp pilus assembly protein TadG